MACLHLDSIDHYSTSEIPDNVLGTQDIHVAVDASGRVENCLKWYSASTGYTQKLDYLRYSPVSIGTSSQGICGFAAQPTGMNALNQAGNQNGWSRRCLISVWGAHGSAHVNLSINPDGTITLFRNDFSAPTLLGATGQAFQDGEWVFIEVEWTLHHTTGTVKVHINNTLSLTFTGDTCANDQFGGSYTTQWTGIAFLNGVCYGNWYLEPEAGYAFTFRLDDFYLLDKDTENNITPWGDTNIGYIKPNGVGNAAQWDRGGSDSGANWSQCDEDAPNGDTDYVSTDVVDEWDTYAHEDIASGATIKAVQFVAYTKKGADGVNTIAPVMRIGSTDYEGPELSVPSNTAYRYVCFPVDVSPATTDPWSASEINAGQFGPKKTA